MTSVPEGLPAEAAPVPAPDGYLRRVFSKPSAWIGVGWLLLVIAGGVLASAFSPYDPIATDLSRILELPSQDHWLGTDQLGRDVLSRLIHGAGQTLQGSFLAVGVALALGLPLGLIAGYYQGWLDSLLNRWADLLLTLPNIIILLAVLAVFGNNVTLAMVGLGILLSAGFLRLATATTKSVRSELFVDAARVFGVPDPRVILRHVLPNMIGPTLVQTFVALGISILVLAGLGFLGLGTRPPFPSWGQMISDASQQIFAQPWLMVPPGLAITLTTVSFNLIGDSARDALPQSTTGMLFSLPRLRGSIRTDSVEEATRESVSTGEGVLLAVRNLSVSFPAGANRHSVVRDVSFQIEQGTTTGLVGESGSGKTMTALAIMGLVPPPGESSCESILFNGRVVAEGDHQYQRPLRGKSVAMISQEPTLSLDPCFKVKAQLRDPLVRILGLSRRDADREALRLLDRVGMDEPEVVLEKYPHELSGGMAQRVAIAWALAGRPQLLIADEPTTSLDVTTQAEILDLIRDLQRESEMTVLLVTHDLGVVADICDRVVVMHDGQLVESASVGEIFYAPKHEYTRSLLDSIHALERGDHMSLDESS